MEILLAEMLWLVGITDYEYVLELEVPTSLRKRTQQPMQGMYVYAPVQAAWLNQITLSKLHLSTNKHVF